MKKEVIIYQSKSGAIELKGDLRKETLWASQAQIVKLFGVDQSVVSRHINNIFKDNEIDEKSNMQKMHIANADKPVAFYSLDVVLSVGYRTNSKVAIEFRKWATKTLRSHILDGYTINRKRIAKNYDSFILAVENVRTLLPAGMKSDTDTILELIKAFAGTWFSLDAYDKNTFPHGKTTKKKVSFVAGDLMGGIAELKAELLKKGEASNLFAVEKNKDAIEGIVGNVMQSFAGEELYPGIEEKAAHLLYFMVKNHPFADGNKRSGAFAFVWYLKRACALNTSKLTPEALTALTLLIAESNPKDKDKMTGLVTMLLRK
ncbi:MAG: virulence protein RhuM/Fic/DOC family protein [Candidatus Schekmanbacteria bacterium]|nr:virulence protein RhuM/Fic/DOC family protein [Candidatus Schekmanbacteria bacterium]